MYGTCSGCPNTDALFQIDGTDRELCRPCIGEQILGATAHEQVRQIHRAAHGYDDPCPTCVADDELTRMRLEEELDAAIARIPWPQP